jgi:hypothetical protein
MTPITKPTDPKPTIQAYGELQTAFDVFNVAPSLLK